MRISGQFMAQFKRKRPARRRPRRIELLTCARLYPIVTSLADYLWAERPDETEPVTFYRPGAKNWGDWSKSRAEKGHLKGSAHGVDTDDPLDIPDIQSEDLAAAPAVAALDHLEE